MPIDIPHLPLLFPTSTSNPSSLLLHPISTSFSIFPSKNTHYQNPSHIPQAALKTEPTDLRTVYARQKLPTIPRSSKLTITSRPNRPTPSLQFPVIFFVLYFSSFLHFLLLLLPFFSYKQINLSSLYTPCLGEPNAFFFFSQPSIPHSPQSTNQQSTSQQSTKIPLKSIKGRHFPIISCFPLFLHLPSPYSLLVPSFFILCFPLHLSNLQRESLSSVFFHLHLFLPSPSS